MSIKNTLLSSETQDHRCTIKLLTTRALADHYERQRMINRKSNLRNIIGITFQNRRIGGLFGMPTLVEYRTIFIQKSNNLLKIKKRNPLFVIAREISPL